jgi:hypothetical protein
LRVRPRAISVPLTRNCTELAALDAICRGLSVCNYIRERFRIPSSPPRSMDCRESSALFPVKCLNYARISRFSLDQSDCRERTADRRMWTLPWDFSGRHMRSPVSGSALGECNTITSRMLSESGLDFASRFSWITLRSAPKSSLCHRSLT